MLLVLFLISVAVLEGILHRDEERFDRAEEPSKPALAESGQPDETSQGLLALAEAVSREHPCAAAVQDGTAAEPAQVRGGPRNGNELAPVRPPQA